MRRRFLTILAFACVLSMGVATSAAQAIVVTDSGTEAGVALVPATRGEALPSGVSAVTSSNPCTDPWLSLDLGGPNMASGGLCYRGGDVINKNETFALTWDAPFPDGSQRHYWSETRGYVEQYLRDVADGSGSLGSPYAVTTQYNDSSGRAQNASVFGGGCIDYGVTGSSTCEYGSPTGVGHNYPASGCTPGGDSFVSPDVVSSNAVCLTDAQLQSEVSTMVTQTGIVGRTQPGYTPLVTLLLPPGVETCLDASHTLCSSNASLTPPPPSVSTNSAGGNIAAGTYLVEVTYMTSNGETVPSSSQTVTTTGATSTITVDSPPSTAGVTGWYAYITDPNGATFWRQQSSPTAMGTAITLGNLTSGGTTPPNSSAFCSYHSQVNVGGTEVAYVVQPWTAGTGCDEPGLPNIPNDPTPEQLSVGVGSRLVSPLSQSEIAAIVNPAFDGWVARDGSEIDDNGGCVPLPQALDSVQVGSSSQNPYYLQREFNNAGVLEFDPNTYFGCAPVVTLSPQFVAPSAVDQGDEIEFDGSATASTLIIPNAGYAWNFGDGTTATGPSVLHSYAQGGTYNVTLTVTDRGANQATFTQSVVVLGASGQSVAQTPIQASSGGASSQPAGPALTVRLQMLPQSLKAVLRSGIAVRVNSTRAANGIASVSMTRTAAKRAHISFGRSPMVVIGVGTVASITNGTVTLHLHLSKRVAAKLAKLGRVTLTVRLALVAAGGQHYAIDAAGRY
jgi:hypothetical protein